MPVDISQTKSLFTIGKNKHKKGWRNSADYNQTNKRPGFKLSPEAEHMYLAMSLSWKAFLSTKKGIPVYTTWRMWLNTH